MNRFKLFLFALLLALSFAAVKALPASAQGFIYIIQPNYSCTEWGLDGGCLGELTVSWNVLEGAFNIVGCEEKTIADDSTVDVYCQYEIMDETGYPIYAGHASVSRSNTSPDDAIRSYQSGVDLLGLSGAFTPGQVESFDSKLEIAENHVEERRYLPAGQLLAAFVYEGTSLVKGDTGADFIIWSEVMDLSEALRAMGVVTPTD